MAKAVATETAATSTHIISAARLKAVLRPQHGEWGPNSWRSCLAYLHDVGAIVLSPQGDVLCSQPALIAKVMALFVASPAHLFRMVGSAELTGKAYLGEAGVAILSRQLIVGRLRTIAELAKGSDADATSILAFLERFDFCYALSEREVLVRAYRCLRVCVCVPYACLTPPTQTYGQSGYMFPSLRPTGSLLYLQPEALDTAVAQSRNWLAVAYTGSSDFILHELFFRLQVRLRGYHDVSYKLFSNGTILRDGTDRALIKLETRSIAIGVEAEHPRRFLGKILRALFSLVPESGKSTPLTVLCPRYCHSLVIVPHHANSRPIPTHAL